LFYISQLTILPTRCGESTQFQLQLNVKPVIILQLFNFNSWYIREYQIQLIWRGTHFALWILCGVSETLMPILIRVLHYNAIRDENPKMYTLMMA